MNRAAQIGVWILIAVVLLLPLYELADYTEVWQHDSDLAAAGLFFLFSGMALLCGNVLPAAVILIVLALIRIDRILPASSPACPGETSISFSPPPRLSFSILSCDLRI